MSAHLPIGKKSVFTVFALTDQQKVIILRRRGQDTYELPYGELEGGERPPDAAIRLLMQLHYVVSRTDGNPCEINPNMGLGACHNVVVVNCQRVKSSRTFSIDISIEVLSQDEVHTLARQGRILNGFSAYQALDYLGALDGTGPRSSIKILLQGAKKATLL